MRRKRIFRRAHHEPAVRRSPRARAWLALATLAAPALFISCASASSPRAQQLAETRWQTCRGIPGVALQAIQSDGTIAVTQSNREGYLQWVECDRKAQAQQGLRRFEASPPPSSGDALQVAVPLPPGLIAVPVWKPGEEWAYHLDPPQDPEIVIWTVDREEIMNSVPYYVLFNDGREAYWRQSDLAFYMGQVAREPETRYVPPRTLFTWPLLTGKTWQITSRREKDGRTADALEACRVAGVETVQVPAGTFQTLKIECRDRKTNSMSIELWYAPAIKRHVRMRSTGDTGLRLEELVGYRVW